MRSGPAPSTVLPWRLLTTRESGSVIELWPPHYREFMERHELSGVEIELPAAADLSELGATIGLYSEAQAIEEADNFYPGLVVKTDGFVPVGQDMTGGGDPYFINLNDAPPGPLYRIYHDSVHDPNYVHDDAVAKVLASYEGLLQFLSSATVARDR